MKLGFRGLGSKIKEASIGDVLQILIVATVVLIIVSFINPNFLFPRYGVGGWAPPPYAYFDVFIRYGTFIFIYFTLIPVFVVWLVKRVLKERWSPRRGLLPLAASLFVLAVIFLVVPGPLHGNPFNIPWFEYPASEGAEGGYQKVSETELDFCGDRIDFFYSPTCCGTDESVPLVETIRDELEGKGSEVKVHIWCKGSNETSCEEYVSGEYSLEQVESLFEEYGIKSFPSLVIGCKYIAAGGFEVEEYKELICEKLDECDF